MTALARSLRAARPSVTTWTFSVPGSPVGVNALWRHGGNRRYRTLASQTWEQAIQWAAREAGVKLLEGREWNVWIIYYHEHAKRRLDVDAPVKLAIDALTGLCWPDDRDVLSVTATRERDQERPRLEIRVEVTE